MPEKELKQIRQVLNQAVQACGMPIREMGRRLEMGHGNLYRLLDGRLDMRVRHLFALADLLGVPLTDFFELGCPDKLKDAQRRLADVIFPPAFDG